MKRNLTSAVAGSVLALLAATSIAASNPPAGLRVEGTTFVLQTGDGRELRGPQLVGAELELGDGSTLRIDGARADPADAGGDIWLHRLSVRVADGEWQNPCDADRDGEREAMPVPGRWTPQGRYVSDPAHFALTCTGGAQAKCLRFGYKPWQHAKDGTSLIGHYEACVRMVRADYCADGEAYTRDGTAIDIFDRHGVQQSDAGDDFRFEAGWSAEGAVCVAHSRIVANIDLQQLGERCPRLRNLLGANCTEQRAHELGAVVFNRSR